MPRSFARVDERLYDLVRFSGNIYGILSLSDNLFPRQTLYFDKSMTDAAGITVGSWTRMSDNWEMFYAMREWLDENRPDLHDVPVAAVDISWAREGNFEMIGGEKSWVGMMYAGYEAAVSAEPSPDSPSPYQTPAGGPDAPEVFSIVHVPEFYDYLNSINRLKADRILPENWSFWPTDGQKREIIGREGCVFWSEPVKTDRDVWVSTQFPAFCSAVDTEGTALVVSADSNAPDAACKLIEILNCDLYAGTLLHLGEEGVHWTMNAAGQAEIMANLGMWNDADLGDVTNCVVPVTAAPDFRELLEARMATAVYSDHMGFRVDYSSAVYGGTLFGALLTTDKLSLTYLGVKTDGTAGEEVGRLMDGVLPQKDLDAAYKTLLYDSLYTHGWLMETLNNCRRQLDAWRAGH